ncbi:hypothetical protein C3L33_19496, partial [Rhododendron williamsianum]
KLFNSLPWPTGSCSSLESAPPPAVCSLARCATGSSRPSKHSTTDGDFLHIQAPKKPKTHECSICGMEFAIGQALGHRPTTDGKAEDRPSLEQSVGSEKRERLLDLSLTLVPMFSVLNLGNGGGEESGDGGGGDGTKGGGGEGSEEDGGGGGEGNDGGGDSTGGGEVGGGAGAGGGDAGGGEEKSKELEVHGLPTDFEAGTYVESLVSANRQC